jgi:ATP-dependent exoDNAse (exonuclease V) beta subunit
MVREAIWDLQEIRDILNLARTLADAGNGPALLGVLRGPACRLTDGEIVLLASWRENGTVQQGLSQVAGATKVPEYPPALDAWNHMEADRIGHLRAVAGRLNAWRRLVDRMPHHELLRLALEESGAFHAMAAWLVPEGTGAETARRVAAGIEFVLDRAREIEQSRPLSMAEMSSILDRHAAGEIRESIDPDLSADEDMVRVMSIHASKGLEAKAVVLLVPELGKRPYRPRGSGMIILDRQYLRAEVSATEAAEYLGLPLMDLRASHEKDDNNQPPSLYRIARGTDNSHFEREEARLFHVAITRSEGTLIVAAPRTLRDKDSRHWPIVWSSAHLVHVDAAALPPALGQEIPCPRDLPPPRPIKASPGRVAIAATRLQDIMELPTRQEQVEALGLVRRGLQAFPAGVPAELLKANQTRAGLGKVVGTLAHRALEMMEALPADQEERLRYLAGQARALLSEDSEDDEPGDGPRVAGEAAQAAESARTIIERLDQPSHAEIRGLAGQPGAAEVDFALPVGDQWLVTGRFDRLLDNGDVVDWKTDKGDPDQIRNRYRGQMGLYALAVSEARRLRGGPEQTARVSLALLSTGEVIPLDYSPEQITAARAGLESLLNIP